MNRTQLKIGDVYEAQECATQKWVRAKLFAKNLQSVTVEWQEGLFGGQRASVGYYEIRPLATPGYYAFRDGQRYSGPHKTETAACRSISNVRDPELFTVDFWDGLEKVKD